MAARRESYQQELRRRRLPRVLLSDGTEPENTGPAPTSSDGAMVGVAASPGIVTGRARVILDPTGAHLEPGEILVAPSTDPGWTPLFLTAGGLVMEMGGANSHGAVVAREYGIPAVVGMPLATERISTGDLVTVNGTLGTVTVDPAGTAEPSTRTDRARPRLAQVETHQHGPMVAADRGQHGVGHRRHAPAEHVVGAGDREVGRPGEPEAALDGLPGIGDLRGQGVQHRVGGRGVQVAHHQHPSGRIGGHQRGQLGDGVIPGRRCRRAGPTADAPRRRRCRPPGDAPPPATPWPSSGPAPAAPARPSASTTTARRC